MTGGGSRPFQVVDGMLAEFERKRDPWRIRLDGWAVWALLRWAVGMGLARLPLSAPRHGLRRSQRLALAFGDVAGWFRLRPSPVLVQSYSSALLEDENGRAKDIWFDDLLARLDPAVKIEQINNTSFLERRRHALRPADLTTELVNASCSVLLRIHRPVAAREAARELVEALRAEFGPEAPDEAFVAPILEAFQFRRRLWASVLSRAAPRVLLVADPGEFGLIAAAKARGVVVVEIQHGIVDRYNPSYSWPAAATPHRTALAIPDRLFTHGEHWRDELAVHGFWGDGLRIVGNPRVDLYRGARANRDPAETRRLVFTSQGIAVDRAANLLAECARAAHGRSGLKIFVKLHPVYDSDPRAYAERLAAFPNVQVLGASELPSTLSLLASADLHASISSATHYDAIALGVPTVVLPLPGHETVAPLVAAGHATLVADGATLCALATGAVLPRVERAVSERYCRAGAVENMLSELAPLLEGSRH